MMASPHSTRFRRSPRCAPSPPCVCFYDSEKTTPSKNSNPTVFPYPCAAYSTATLTHIHCLQRTNAFS